MADLPVGWSREAQQDLLGIAGYIAEHNSGAAVSIFDKLLARAAALGTLSSRGRLVPELRGKTEPPLREVIEGPWRILYAVDRNVVIVTGVVDSRRDVAQWLKERLGLEPSPVE